MEHVLRAGTESPDHVQMDSISLVAEAYQMGLVNSAARLALVVTLQ
jgi:hypothetical protein